MEECNSISTPVDCGAKLSKNDEDVMIDPTLYKSLVKYLRTLIWTGLDITYGVGLVSRFMEEPKTTYWNEAKRILGYVWGIL